MRNRKLKIAIIFLGIIVLNFLTQQVNYQVDLTSDKRYSIGQEARDILNSNNDYFVITVLLEGNVPPSFRAYRTYLDQYIKEVQKIRPNISVIYKNPNEGSAEEVNSLRTFLRSKGVRHISRQVNNAKETRQSVIYPYLSVHNEKTIEFVDLLDAKQGKESEQSAVLRSMAGFEEKLIKSIRNIAADKLNQVAVIGSNNDILASAWNQERSVNNTHQFNALNGEQLLANLDSFNVVIALASEDLDRSILFGLDQAVMHGIPVMWLVDKVTVDVAAIRDSPEYYAVANELNIEDMLFKWGVKINPDLVSDLRCSPIPQVVGTSGGQPQTVLINYPYHLLADGSPAVNLSKSLTDVNLQFASSIDTIKTKTLVTKHPILTTSSYTRVARLPIPLDFDFLRVQPNPDDYNFGPKMVGISIKGEFESYFSNRLTDNDISQLASNNIEYLRSSKEVDQIVISDSDFLKPVPQSETALFPIGYDRWSRKMYDGNAQLFSNILEYLTNGELMLNLKRDQIELGEIDINKFKQGKSTYYSYLFGVPILLFCLAIFIFRYRRRKVYG